MIKIVFCGSAPFVGTDYAFVEVFNRMPSTQNLDNLAWEYAIEHANSYGQVFDEDDEDDEGYDPENSRHFLEHELSGYWEIYDPEKHDDILG
jgi:hypothetical protein